MKAYTTMAAWRFANLTQYTRKFNATVTRIRK